VAISPSSAILQAQSPIPIIIIIIVAIITIITNVVNIIIIIIIIIMRPSQLKVLSSEGPVTADHPDMSVTGSRY
jgi:hypothetical protein